MPATGGDALAALGWDEGWAEAAARAAAPERGVPVAPGRIGRVDMGRVTVLTATGPVRATPGEDSVATGDWILHRDERVVAVLPRRSAFVRGDPMEGAARGPQVVAANVDVVLVVQSLSNGPNARRLERELVLAYESGARPVVALTKADEADAAHVDASIQLASDAAPGVDVVVTSSVSGVGVDEVRALASDNRTIALIGASGVGKSTLVNALVGTDVQATGDVRAGDQRGRHTTTARELILIPGGGVLIDTPGLRAVSLWDADDGLSRAFADIEELAAQCRFSDCSHTSEPGCAVLAAIDGGALDRARYEHYVRLDSELDDAERRRRGRILSKGQKQHHERFPGKYR